MNKQFDICFIKDNSSYLFANVHCNDDSVCHRPGCYKSDQLARKNRRKLQRQQRSQQSSSVDSVDLAAAAAAAAESLTTSTTGDSSIALTAAVSMSMIDELRCNTSINRCFGMGVEYNVFAMCKFLLKVSKILLLRFVFFDELADFIGSIADVCKT